MSNESEWNGLSPFNLIQLNSNQIKTNMIIFISNTLNFHSLYFIRWTLLEEDADSLPSPAYVKCSRQNLIWFCFCFLSLDFC